MTKPLHEQLRETKPSGCIRSSLSGLTNINPPCGDRLCEECTKEQLDALADRIENEYIPRPRYEDGEIVQFDDTVNDKLRGDVKVDRISFTRSGFYFGASHNAKGERIVEKIRYDYGEPVKRPDSPVLDADGVEIKVGDVVYLADGDCSVEFIVDALPAPNFYKAVQVVSGGVHTSYDPPRLTHRKPVFDTNGVRICKGDTVWDIDSGEELTVEDFPNRKCGLVQCSGEDGDCDDHDAHNLTHQEPDSLEKLRDDLKTSTVYAENPVLDQYIDRLTALIERGA